MKPGNGASARVEMVSKKGAKERGQQSPDRAEALVLAFARVVPRQQTIALGVPVTISQSSVQQR